VQFVTISTRISRDPDHTTILRAAQHSWPRDPQCEPREALPGQCPVLPLPDRAPIETAFGASDPALGGAIVVDHTEALVAIDVIPARHPRQDIERRRCAPMSKPRRNCPPIALARPGGLLVIDFIDMENRAASAKWKTASRCPAFPTGRGCRWARSRVRLMELSRQRLALRWRR